MPSKIVPEALDFIFEYTKNAPEQQLKDVEALDGKMIQLFSFASVIIGLGGLTSGSGRFSAVFLGPAIVFYVGVGIAAFQHLRPREFRRSLQADLLWRKFWKRDVADIKHSLVSDVADAYAHNKKYITEKGETLHRATFALTGEVVLMGLALLVGRLG